MIRVILMAVATVILLLVIAGGGLYFALGQAELKADFAKLQQQWRKPPPAIPEDQVTYYTMPELRALINPRGPTRELVLFAAALRLHSSSDQIYIQNTMPVIVDAFQSYFRDEEISGHGQAVDVGKLKRVMIQRINGIIAPGKIDDILFRELAVQ